MKSKSRKRLLIYLFIPILTAIPFLTEDLILRIISAIVLLVYVGFIIFLRDSIRVGFEEKKTFEEADTKKEEIPEEDEQKTDVDDGEDFKIISENKDLEVITDETFRPSSLKRKKDFFKPSDFKENFDKIVTEQLPANLNHDEQFAFVLEKILTVVKDAFMAHTAIFFWYNKKKQRLTLEKFISGSSDITEQKFEIEDDILSKIVQKEEPELLTDITPKAERDVIRYYAIPQGIRSFVGVPLFYGKHLSGVLALDSKDGDAFGIETIYSLGRFVRVISIIIYLFEEKFAESQSEQRLKALLTVLSTDKKFDSETELFSSLETAVKNLIGWDAFTFVYFNPVEQKFKTTKIINKTSLKYVGENLEVELSGTLVGKSIISGIPVKIDDTSDHEYIRFAQKEDVSFDGSFLAVPLIYDEQNYGVLCFESLKKNVYTNSDVTFLKNSTKLFAFILYSFSTQTILKNLLSVDIDTKTLNQKSFVENLSADLIKAKEVKAESAIALIKIDEFIEEDSLFEGNPFPKVLKAVSTMIRDEITNVNLFGRLSDKIFGVYFFNSSTKDVFLWAEKLRIKIARKPIAVVSKQTTFTVSVGVASATNKTDVEEVLYNAQLALDKALEKGGNSVKSIN